MKQNINCTIDKIHQAKALLTCPEVRDGVDSAIELVRDFVSEHGQREYDENGCCVRVYRFNSYESDAYEDCFLCNGFLVTNRPTAVSVDDDDNVTLVFNGETENGSCIGEFTFGEILDFAMTLANLNAL